MIVDQIIISIFGLDSNGYEKNRMDERILEKTVERVSVDDIINSDHWGGMLPVY